MTTTSDGSSTPEEWLRREARASVALDGETQSLAPALPSEMPQVGTKRRPRKLPALVTLERLEWHQANDADKLTGREIEAMGQVVKALRAIANGER